MIVTVVSESISGWAYYRPWLYRLGTLKNGTVVWKKDKSCGSAHRSHRLADSDARAYAGRNGLEYQPGIRHNQPADVPFIRMAVQMAVQGDKGDR